MEFKDLFAAMAIVLVGVIAFFSLATDFNTAYNTDLGSDMTSTRTHVEDMLNSTLKSVSGSSASATEATEGASIGSGDEGLARRALRVITNIPKMFGLVPAVMRDGASVLGIPPEIVVIGEWVFLFAAAVTLAYLLLLGVSRLRS